MTVIDLFTEVLVPALLTSILFSPYNSQSEPLKYVRSCHSSAQSLQNKSQIYVLTCKGLPDWHFCSLSLYLISTTFLELMVSATLAPCVLNTHQNPPFPLCLSTSSDPTWNALCGWCHHFLRALPTCHLPMWSLMLKDTPALIFPHPYLLRKSFRISLTTEFFIYTFLVHPLSP